QHRRVIPRLLRHSRNSLRRRGRRRLIALMLITRKKEQLGAKHGAVYLSTLTVVLYAGGRRRSERKARRIDIAVLIKSACSPMKFLATGLQAGIDRTARRMRQGRLIRRRDQSNVTDEI